MTERITTEPGPAGVPRAVKRCPDAPDALRHEAAVLDRLRHPGVVELIGLTESDGGPVLRTVLAGPRSLADGASPLAPGPAIAALATTIADIHDLGWVHGRLQPDHVVLGTEGRPVLCGLAGAAPVGEPRPSWAEVDEAWADPAHERGAPVTPALDVYGLGRLLAWLLDRGGDAASDRRLSALAAQATNADPALRPPARSVAAALQSASPADDDTEAAPRRGRRWTRTLPRAATVGLCVIAIAAAAWFWPDSSPPAPADGNRRRAAVKPTTPTPSQSTSTSTPVRRVWPRLDRAPDGTVVTAGRARFAVGRRGDHVVVADWDCDGTPTPALVRPTTGEVFVFDRWAASGHDLTVPAAAIVPGGQAPQVDDADDDGCSRLLVVDGQGRRHPVRTETTR